MSLFKKIKEKKEAAKAKERNDASTAAWKFASEATDIKKYRKYGCIHFNGKEWTWEFQRFGSNVKVDTYENGIIFSGSYWLNGKDLETFLSSACAYLDTMNPNWCCTYTYFSEKDTRRWYDPDFHEDPCPDASGFITFKSLLPFWDSFKAAQN